MSPENRDALCELAQEYADNGEPLPADLISDLMVNGIDHTQYTQPEPTEEQDPHNVD